MESAFDPTQNAAFILFSFFIPVLVALVKQSGFPDNLNRLIALAVYVIVGALAVVFSGVPVTIENVAPLAATATLVGSAAYNLFWNAIGPADNTLDARLTNATSVNKGP